MDNGIKEEFNCVVRIRVQRVGSDTDHAFGRGTATLLLGVQEHNSLNKACKRMGMSYSKAWNSINATEEHLGFKLIEREGARGSRLTERGKRFLEVYELAEAAARASVESILRHSNF